MGMFDAYTKNARVLSEDEMRNVKAGEKYYYKITCSDGREYSDVAPIENDDFKSVVDALCGKDSEGNTAIFC